MKRYTNFKMNAKVKLALALIAALIGVFLVWFGEIDDSPGGMLLGCMIVIIGIFGVVKVTRKK